MKGKTEITIAEVEEARNNLENFILKSINEIQETMPITINSIELRRIYSIGGKSTISAVDVNISVAPLF